MPVGTAEGNGDEDQPPQTSNPHGGSEGELFTNLMGNHDESLAQVKKRKTDEKRQLVEKTKNARA